MRPLLIVLSIAMLSACGGGKEDSQVTDTRMDDIESLEGTISDDMINTDESTDEAPLEPAPALQGPPKAKGATSDEENPAEEPAPETEDKAKAE